MKKSSIILIIIMGLITTALFVVSCTCVYAYELNIRAFWWTWFAAIWVFDLVGGVYIFYSKRRSDEFKSFWLFILLVLPILGAVIVFCLGQPNQPQFNNPDNNHTLLLSNIYSAKKSIKIYSDSMFWSFDLISALNYASWKKIDITIICNNQHSKSKQKYLCFLFDKCFDKKIKIFFSDRQASHTFMIIDDKDTLVCDKNFNYSNIYQANPIFIDKDPSKYLDEFNFIQIRTSQYMLCEGKYTDKYSTIKRIGFAFVNIFYPFF